MKLLFICSSLEPGQDGVGDYVRRLADQLRLAGNQVALVSLNDKVPCLDHKLDQSGVIRLSATLAWSDRLHILSSFCSSFDPEWISLQYVPYGFSKKGLPLRLPSQLKGIGSTAKWHLMFHELWVGITRASPLKHKLVGSLQRQIAKDLVRRLQPVVINTTNPLYVHLLSGSGIASKRLPLFSSISGGARQHNWISDELKRLGIPAEFRKDWFLAGMFGSCYPDYPLENQVRRAAGLAETSGKRLAVLGIGGGVGTGDIWEQRVRAAVPMALVWHFGRQDEKRISELLSSLDLGMPCTPAEYLGKSGVAAAMVQHCAMIDTSYTVDLPEYRHLHLRRWPPDSLFWTLEKVANELQLSFAKTKDA